MIKYLLISITIVFSSLLIPLKGSGQLSQLEIQPMEPHGQDVYLVGEPDLVIIFIRSNLSSLRFDSTIPIVDIIIPDEHIKVNPNLGNYLLVIEPVRQYISVEAEGFMKEYILIEEASPRRHFYYSIKPME